MQVDILNLLNFKVGHIAENEHDFQIKVETNSPPSHSMQARDGVPYEAIDAAITQLMSVWDALSVESGIRGID